MAKKKLKKKVQRKPAAGKVAKPAAESARDIWLAGLGAFSVAQQESGKMIEQGSKLFDKLVEEGNKVEKQTRKGVEDTMGDLRGEFESRVKEFRGDIESRFGGVRDQAESVRKQANENWDRLENIFEERVARVMARLGIPTRDDVNALSRRVQELSRRVAELDKKTRAARAAPKKAAKKKAAPKKAAKKAAAKKSAKKTTKKAGSKKTAQKTS